MKIVAIALVATVASGSIAMAANCEEWNTSNFFVKAKAADIRACVDAGVDLGALDIVGETPLHHAVFSKDPDSISVLLEFGANVRARNALGETPLHKAAVNNHDAAVIKRLLASGADVHARDKTGATALHLAADFNTNPAVISALINAGADIEARDNSGLIALDYAARREEIRQTAILPLLTP